MLCPHLTVAANIFLGDEEMRGGLLNKKRMVRDAQTLLDDLGFSLPAGALLSSLTIGQQQLVATARAERRGAKFLIFDEPTAYLTRQEAAALFKLIRRLKANGVTIVYISHRLEEVFELCDRVSVLRDGALVGTRHVSETNEADLIALMINRTIEQIYHKDAVPIGATILETDKLTGPGFERRLDHGARRRDRRALRPDRRRPQRVRAERLRPPSGDRRAHRLAGQATSRIRSERQAMDLGIALAPESRRDQGLCLNLGVDLNINLPIFERLSMGPLINLGREAAAADQQIRDVQIKTAVARGAGRQPVRRQPAEDRDRQVAQSRRQALHLRRADGRRRRRHQGGNLPAARLAAQARRGHHHDLVLPAGGLRTRRHAARLPGGQARRHATDTRTPPTKRSSPRRSAFRARGFKPRHD